MSFTPIARTDKLRAATLNSRLDELAALLTVFDGNALTEIVPWTALDGSTSVIDITNIPQTYNALYLRHQLAETGTSLVAITFNNDGGANYNRVSTGFAASSAQVGNAFLDVACNSNVARIAPVDTWIFDYTGTYKLFLEHQFQSEAVFGFGLKAGSYSDAAAIESIQITCSGGNYLTTSRYALYAI